MIFDNGLAGLSPVLQTAAFDAPRCVEPQLLDAAPTVAVDKADHLPLLCFGKAVFGRFGAHARAWLESRRPLGQELPRVA